MKLLIVGAGGIGSYVLEFLYQLMQADQIPEDFKVTVADDDIVEVKNLRYQNFRPEDLNIKKVFALQDYYGLLDGEQYMPKHRHWLDALDTKISTKEDFQDFDIIVGAVDGKNNFRKILFNYFEDLKDSPEILETKMWWDLRAEGRNIVMFSKNKKNTLESMLSVTDDSEDGEGVSCQRTFELEQGWIQQGNKVVALLWSQQFLDYIRGNLDEIPATFDMML